MPGFSRKKSEKERLYDIYRSLLEEAHNLFYTDRKLSDQKVFEAEEKNTPLIVLSCPCTSELLSITKKKHKL